ncbi:YgaP family membrane protein [Terrimonas alba]|uniref:YgaP family membrane protein n=1 Tax=Terrimonas alba TaxID=3349636 RepID=UPI0035F2A235
MKCNVGKTDRTIRLIIAIAIGAAGLYFKSWWGLVAILPLITSYAGFCPLYSLLGISTCHPKINVN